MLWLKAFHIIAVICWFAGIFYLPRLFVYHAATEDQTGKDRFKTMERKLYRGIMTPSAIITIVLGAALASLNWDYYQTQTWFIAKLSLVVPLIIFHYLCSQHLRAFAEDANKRSHTYFRWFNEVPVLLLVAIVILVVVRPF